MIVKKISTFIIIVTFLIVLLTGCSSSKVTNGAKEPSSITKKEAGGESSKVEFEFLNQKREAADTYQAVIDAFNKEYPNIKVTLNTVPDAGDVLMTRASSDTLPDVIMHWPSDAQYVQFANEGILADLSSKDYVKNIKADYVNTLRMDGKIYILPLSLNFMGVYYNVDLFKEAGLTIPKTWDEFIKTCDTIKTKGDVPILLPNKDSWTVSQLWSNIEGKDRGSNTEIYKQMTSGASSYSKDELYKSSLEKMVTLTKDYSQGDTLSLGYDQAINDFAYGAAYMFIQGSWALPSIEAANPDINVAMFPMPNESGNMKQPVGVDSAICVSQTAAEIPEKMDAIDQFLGYLFSEKGAQLYSDLDHSPSAIEAVKADIPNAKAVLDLIETDGILDVSSPPTGFENTKRSKIQTVLMDGDIDEFLSELSKDWKETAAVDAK